MAIKMTRAEYEKKYGQPPIMGGKQPTQTQQVPLANKVANFFGAKGITDQFGADIARARAPKEQRDFVEYPSEREVVGSAAQFGANFIPGAGVGANLSTKIGVGAATGYAFDVGSKLQDKSKTVGQSLTPGLGTAIGAAVPVAGKLISEGVKKATPVVGSFGKVFWLMFRPVLSR